mgnify:CR=1 FL=1
MDFKVYYVTVKAFLKQTICYNTWGEADELLATVSLLKLTADCESKFTRSSLSPGEPCRVAEGLAKSFIATAGIRQNKVTSENFGSIFFRKANHYSNFGKVHDT